MPLYHYKALNSRGEALDGQMEAASDAEVVLRLQEQGHLPVEARLASEGGGEPAWRALFKAKPFAGERLVQFRSEEHTSELQSLMRISYAVFCLKKNIHNNSTLANA